MGRPLPPQPRRPHRSPELAAQAQLRQALALITADPRPNGLAHIGLDPDGTVRIHWPQHPDTSPDSAHGQGGLDGPQGGPAPPGPVPDTVLDTVPARPWPEGFVDDQLAMQARDASDAGARLPTDPVERARVLRAQWLRRQTPSFPTPRPGSGLDASPYPQPVAPTAADHAWAEHTDPTAARQHHWITEQLPTTPTSPAPHGGWPTLTPPAPTWSDTALRQALAAMTRTPAAPLPPASSSYPFTGRLARHLKTRDQNCRFPGCTRLAQHCDSDHRIPWPTGPTTISNGISECTHHHQAKHALFTLTAHPDGTLTWTLPTGHHANSPPRPLLRGW